MSQDNSEDGILPQHEGLEARIARLVVPTLEHLGYELVRAQLQGRERPTLQIMADRADGSQITLEDCEAISHAVGAVLDVEDPITSAWTLEVSSAGIDRPLTRTKDWNRFAGHLATVELNIPQEGRRRLRGTLLGADEAEARLRLEDGTDVAVPRGNIRRAKLVLTDALIEATAAEAGLSQGDPLEGDLPDTLEDQPEAAAGTPSPRRGKGNKTQRN